MDFCIERQLLRLLSLLRCNFCRGFSSAQGCLGENHFSISLFWLAKTKRVVWHGICLGFQCQDCLVLSAQFLANLVLRNTLTFSFQCLLPLPPLFFFSHCYFFCRFINARRRIVQPMIDQSNRAGKSPLVTLFKLCRH